MIETFKLVFNRPPSTKEIILLRRLRKLYGEELVSEAIRLSLAIQDNPIKYIIAVANNLYKDSQKQVHSLREETLKKLEELKKYGVS
jgi:hypothetical protein